jgi:serine/threonine-protein kinase
MVHLLRPLGEGGMGKVWVARHNGLETDVVVKFLAHEAGADREEAEARFAREAAAAAAVKSPHVVQVFDHGTTADGTRYIVMELLEGRDLSNHLSAKGPMAPKDVAGVVSQIAKALSKAHQVGVIHRDIKPENIFLCDGEAGEMFVKVLDFGVAKREHSTTSKTTTGQVVGTPYYMSPEQILGEPPVDARTDIWSLGVVAFEALTGKRPFDGPTVGAVTLAIHSVTPHPSAVVPGLPPTVDEWFLRACAQKPDQRFPTVREAAQALIAAVDETSQPSGLFRATMTSIADTSDPALAARFADGSAPTTSTTTTSSFSTPAMNRGPSAMLLGGAAGALVVLGALLVFAFAGNRHETATQTARTTASASPTIASGSAPTASTPSEGPTAAPSPPASASGSSSPTPPPSGSVELAGTVATATTARSRPATGRAPGVVPVKRPPRRPNDDDIK